MKRYLLLSTSTMNVGLQGTYQLVVLYFLGFGLNSDVYYAALAIPGLVGSVLYGVLTFSALPLLARLNREAVTATAKGVLGNFGVLIVAVYVFAILINYLTADYIFAGFFPENGSLYLMVSSILLISGCLFALALIPAMAAKAMGRYSLVEVVYGISSLCAVISLTSLSRDASPDVIAVVDLARNGFVLFVLIWWIPLTPKFCKQNLTLSPELRKGIGSLVTGNVLMKVLPVVDRALSAMGAHGDVTILHLINQASSACNKVFSSAVAVPGMVQMSQCRDKGSRHQVYVRLSRLGIKTSLLLYGPPALCCLAAILLEIAQLDRIKHFVTIVACGILASGGLFVGGLLGQITSSFFYSQGDAGRPMAVSVMNAAITTVLRIFLVGSYGFVGLIFCGGLHQILNLMILEMLVRSRLKDRL